MIPDGQNQHSTERYGVELSREALRLLGRHLRGGHCPKTKIPLDPTSYIPVQFITKEGEPKAVIVCGACKKELGEAEVKCSSQPAN